MTDPAARLLYLDCDTGIDDALALAYLVATPSVDLRGVGTVSGNTDAATAARSTVDLLALLDRSDIPVAVGARDPLGSRFGGGTPAVHGTNGTGDVDLPRASAEPVAETADAMLLRLAHEHPGELHVLATGPLTNLARALRRDPALPGWSPASPSWAAPPWFPATGRRSPRPTSRTTPRRPPRCSPLRGT
ncbi:hypothetical protein BJF77_06645 [Kocuria sp. CNJ-770]|nr:hypothetical protein BJF77_06645 [Kocuria sp. CNJ-770]